MGRPIFKIDHGGIGDASILGRFVWMGFEPGKITQALMSLGTTRLIILLDEVACYDAMSRCHLQPGRPEP
jgi:ATP-dependent Lon protease